MGSNENSILNHRPYILESFYYTDEITEKLIPYFGDFLLDSGAYTLRQNTEGNVNWIEYTERYADFINRNGVDKFFELDIDNLIGYEETVKLRDRLESLTGKQCIPVWHPSRGYSEFVRSTEEYSYVALGGIVGSGKNTKENKRYQSAFPMFIKQAHKNQCKIHGLGYTSLEGIKKYHFDSVDSTAWTTGNRFGYIYHFNGETMEKIDVPKGKRIADSKKVALINFLEWIKFSQYAERKL